MKIDDNQMQKIKSEEEEKVKKIKSYGYQILSSVCLVIMQMNVKKLSDVVSPFLVLGMRGSMLFLINTFFIYKSGIDFNIRNSNSTASSYSKHLIFQSSDQLLVHLHSLKYIPLGVANTLFNTGPIMTIFIEIFLFKKGRIHWIHFVITFLSFLGIMFIIQPDFLFGVHGQEIGQNLIYYIMVLLSALTSSFSMIFLHNLGGKCDELVALQYAYIFQGIANYLVYFFQHSHQDESLQMLQTFTIAEILQKLVYFLLMTTFSFFTQYLRAKSLFLCSPSLVQPFSYITVLLGMTIDLILFEASYNVLMIIGAILTSLGLFTKIIILKCLKNI